MPEFEGRAMPLAPSRGSSPNWERQPLPGNYTAEARAETRPLREDLMSVVDRRQCSWQNEVSKPRALLSMQGRSLKKCSRSINRS